ncbi:DUF1641 domain-containing protein [Paenibacillus wenxiniae]|uniref:DUF1641 domain-containing protein n=1 Tax=Paenibacillus wenxiniae TaxID=1636843 RepID=A0ABW4RMF8_9BACL
MARAINRIERHEPTAAEIQAESLSQVIDAIASNKEAIVKTIGIVKELNDAGILDIASAALENRTELGLHGVQLINALNLPPLLKNGLTMVQMFGSIDPLEMNRLINALGSSLGQISEIDPTNRQYGDHIDKEPPGMLALLKMMRDPDVRTTMTFGLHFLKAMGGELNKPKPEEEDVYSDPRGKKSNDYPEV